MNAEIVYDLALLGVAAVLIIAAALLVAYADLPLEFATAMLGGGVGVLGARSGRALVASSRSDG